MFLIPVIADCATQNSGSSVKIKTITDMDGRTLTVPDQITRVLSTYPPTSEMVYMITPDKLMGWQTSEKNMTYMPEKYRMLSVVGGWYGGLTADYETFILMNTDIIFMGFTKAGNYQEPLDTRPEKFRSIPYNAVEDTTDVSKFAPTIKYMGEILGEEQKAAELTSFYQDIQKISSIVATIPIVKRRKSTMQRVQKD